MFGLNIFGSNSVKGITEHTTTFTRYYPKVTRSQMLTEKRRLYTLRDFHPGQMMEFTVQGRLPEKSIVASKYGSVYDIVYDSGRDVTYIRNISAYTPEDNEIPYPIFFADPYSHSNNAAKTEYGFYTVNAYRNYSFMSWAKTFYVRGIVSKRHRQPTWFTAPYNKKNLFFIQVGNDSQGNRERYTDGGTEYMNAQTVVQIDGRGNIWVPPYKCAVNSFWGEERLHLFNVTDPNSEVFWLIIEPNYLS